MTNRNGRVPGSRNKDVIPCPSGAAYKRHIRHGEVPCEEDYDEVNRANAARRAAGPAEMSQGPDRDKA